MLSINEIDNKFFFNQSNDGLDQVILVKSFNNKVKERQKEVYSGQDENKTWVLQSGKITL